MEYYEPRSKFIKKFDNFSGIVKAYDPIKEKLVFVVYGYLMPEDLRQDTELGDAIGTGDSKELALIDAVKNLVEMKRFTDNRIYEFVESLQAQCSLKKIPEDPNEKVILPISAWEYESDGNISDPKDKYWNAQIYINEKDQTIYSASK